MRWQEDTALRHQRKIETNLSRRLRPVGLGRLIFLPLTRRCFYYQLVVKEYGDPPPELVLEVSFARPEALLEVRFSPSLARPELVLKVLVSPGAGQNLCEIQVIRPSAPLTNPGANKIL